VKDGSEEKKGSGEEMKTVKGILGKIKKCRK
jgi:hypothetical protein